MAKKKLLGMVALVVAIVMIMSCAEPYIFPGYAPPPPGPDTTGIAGAVGTGVKWYINATDADTKRLNYFEFTAATPTTGKFSYTYNERIGFGLKRFEGTYSVTKDSDNDILTYVVTDIVIGRYTAANAGASPPVVEKYEEFPFAVFSDGVDPDWYLWLSAVDAMTPVQGQSVYSSTLDAWIHSDTINWAKSEKLKIDAQITKSKSNFADTVREEFYDEYLEGLAAAFKTWIQNQIIADTKAPYNDVDTVAKATDPIIASWKADLVTRLNATTADSVYTYNQAPLKKFESWDEIEAVIMEKGSGTGSGNTTSNINGFTGITFTYSTATNGFLKTSTTNNFGVVTQTLGAGFTGYLNDLTSSTLPLVGADATTAPSTTAHATFAAFLTELDSLFNAPSVITSLSAANQATFLPNGNRAGISTFNSFIFEFGKNANDEVINFGTRPQLVTKTSTTTLADLYGFKTSIPTGATGRTFTK